jgi:hypothetical protein
MTHLILDFPQHFLFADIIDSQGFPDTRDQSSLEGEKCQRNVIDLRLHEVSKRVGRLEVNIPCGLIQGLLHPQ